MARQNSSSRSDRSANQQSRFRCPSYWTESAGASVGRRSRRSPLWVGAGINFIDTAQYYRTYPYIRKALSSFSGADPIICSKSLSVGKQEMLSAIEEARQALNRDVIDIFLLHEVRSGQLSQREGALEALVDAKARGLIRAIGLSTHHVDIVNAASQAEDLDVIFPLVNYKGLGIRQGEQFASAEDMMTAIRLCFQKGKGCLFHESLRRRQFDRHLSESSPLCIFPGGDSVCDDRIRKYIGN